MLIQIILNLNKVDINPLIHKSTKNGYEIILTLRHRNAVRWSLLQEKITILRATIPRFKEMSQVSHELC